ncbi:hypothetical protein [Dyella japonica]|uniref:hypothetical protein n=1 Tax=Dyella japonica TaxID=231455 RepID=UPI0011847610|nr:hypothetical protein [Dyella japonica]
MYYSIAKKRHAFSCGQCGHCFLSNGDIQFFHLDHDRAFVDHACESAQQWLDALNIGVRVDCIEYGIVKKGVISTFAWGRDGRLDTRDLYLSALRRSSDSVPSWLREPVAFEGELSIASVHRADGRPGKGLACASKVRRWVIRDVKDQNPLAGLLGDGRPDPEALQQVAHGLLSYKRRCDGFTPKQWRSDVQKLMAPLLSICEPSVKADLDDLPRDHVSRRFVERQHLAIRRVTATFLKSIAPNHGDCWEVVDKIRGLSGHGHRLEPELLDCCPLALGFWLWRDRATWVFGDVQDRCTELSGGLGSRMDAANLDVLLYALERSDLHASVIAAHYCLTGKIRAEEEASYLHALDLWRGGRHYFSAEHEMWLDYGEQAHAATFVRADATCLMRSVKCTGMEPYFHALRKWLRAIPAADRPIGETRYKDFEHAWTEYSERPFSPVPTAHDAWLFFGGEAGA